MINPPCRVRAVKIHKTSDDHSDQDLGYWVTGILLGPLEPGRPIRILRENRNGVAALGLFLSSPVEVVKEGIDCVYVHTRNSVWMLETDA